MSNVRRTLCVLLLLTAFTGMQAARAVERIPPDPRAVKVIESFMAALKIQDPQARLQAVIPLVHKSLLTADGRDLARSVKDFSYKKAVADINFYPTVKITEVHKGSVLTIGFKESAERGRDDKYFVAQTVGRPAPIHVFFPQDGGDPKIVNFGSL